MKPTLINRILRQINELAEKYLKVDPFETALYITLVVFCIERWEVRPLLLVCSLGLVVRPWVRSPIYWGCVSVIYFATHVGSWYSQANHHFLLGYWCLAIILSLISPSPGEALAKSARWMVGLVFFLTVIWKLLTPEFVDGGFFEYTILADPRFSPVGMFVGLDPDTLAGNRELLSRFVYTSNPSSEVALTTVPGVPLAASILTWWTLLIEGAVALVFLLPDRWIGNLWRHSMLLIFILTTYMLAPVAGFGWSLVAMGMGQVRASTKPIFIYLYIAGFILVFLGKNPGLRGILLRLDIF